MATAATSLLGLALPVTGELSGTWGDTVNISITALLDTAVAGTTTLSSDADVTLTTTTLAANEARQAIILWTAGGTATRTITVPAQSKSYIVINKTSSSQSIKIVGAGPTTGVTIVAGTAALVVWNGVDFVTASVTSTTGVLPVANGGTGLTSGTSGGVLAYTASGTLASSTALAASALVIGGGAGVAPSTTTTGTGVVTALGVNTGTAGAFVVNGGALGTPSSGTVTNLTGTASININGTVGATTPAAGAFTSLTASTTLGVTGVSTLTAGAVIQGLTVGRGAGAVATNTAVGASALAANTSGTRNTAVGSTAASGVTGSRIVAIGDNVLATATSGNDNVAIGDYTMRAYTGSSSTAVGAQAMANSTSNSGDNNTAIGAGALNANAGGASNTAVGSSALTANITASSNTAVGYKAGYTNETGQSNVYLGTQAGRDATSGTNVFVGKDAGLTVTSGAGNTYIGFGSGPNSSVGTGTINTTLGYLSGNALTSGSKNTIIGAYSGNQGSLDIRTASNYVVLSDGDGNPRGIFDGSGNLLVGTTSAFSASGISPKVTISNTAGIGLIAIGNADAGMVTQPAANTNYYAGFFLNSSSTGVGNISCTGSLTIYNTTSDYRLKTAISAVTGHGERIDSLKPIDYQWKRDNSQARGFLAHEFKTVYPNSVTGDKDAVDADGKPMYQAMQASTSEVIADLVAELQSLRARVAQLESKP